MKPGKNQPCLRKTRERPTPPETPIGIPTATLILILSLENYFLFIFIFNSYLVIYILEINFSKIFRFY
jgi:hypothetical protein